MKKIPSILATFSAVVASLILFAVPPQSEKSRPLDEFMRQKRHHTQACLDALMFEDFEAIIAAGENLKRMQEDKRWGRILTDEYKRHSQELEKRAQAMVDSARTNNLDGAMEAFTRTLETCYSCHKYVRAQVNKYLP